MDVKNAQHCQAGLVVERSAGPTVNTNVRSMMLTIPSAQTDNALTVKKPSASWGDPAAVPYGSGQAIEVLNELDADPTQSALWRVDAMGSWGGQAGHVAPGVHQSGTPPYAPTQALWVNPSVDCYGVVIDNPTTTDVAGTPTGSLLLLRDVRTRPAYNVVEVTPDGTLHSNKALVARPRTTTDVALTVQRVKGQTAALSTWLDDAGSELAKVLPNGFTWSRIGMMVSSAAPTSGGLVALTVSTVATGQYGIVVKPGQTGQLRDLFIVQDTANAILSRFDRNGYFMTRLHAAPSDTDLAPGEVAMYFDASATAPRVMFKGKDLKGGVHTASLSMV